METAGTNRLKMDDEAAMFRVKNGEVKELDILFRRHSRGLFGYFYGMSRDPSMSEDLVQEVFWRILRFRDSFNEQMRFSGWLYRIARNLYIDRVRQEKKERMVDIDEHMDRPDHSVVSPHKEAVRRDDQERLLVALDSLKPEQREILVLARFEGLSFREVGDILGCSESSARVRAFRALQALKAVYLREQDSN